MKFNKNYFLIIALVQLLFGCMGETFMEVKLGAGVAGSNDEAETPVSTVPTLTCPTGYVAVPANVALGVDEFCVMQYEAKAWIDTNTNGAIDAGEVDTDGCLEGGCTTANWGIATHSPVSTATGSPWVKIDQTNAWNECDSLNSEALRADIDNDTGGDGTYAMISNPEWITIARNAENVDSNWSGVGGVGDGTMARGWAAHTAYGDAWVNSAVAPSSESTCLYNTGANACGATGTHLYRRTLTLSNGSDIWDLGANVYEWVDWSYEGALTSGPTSCPGAYAELPSVACGALADADYNTLNGTYDFNQGVGRFYGGAGGAALRGGFWLSGANAGAFTLYLGLGPTNTYTSIGFRCRWRP